MLHCPHCHRQHQTLRTLLTCCPAELRRITDLMDRDLRRTLANYTIADLLTGTPLPPRLQRALTTDTPQEAA